MTDHFLTLLEECVIVAKRARGGMGTLAPLEVKSRSPGTLGQTETPPQPLPLPPAAKKKTHV